MRLPLFALIALTACSNDANHLCNPLMLPVSGISTAFGNAAYAQRRGRVEVLVKSNYAAIMADIRSGGGPALSAAFDTAGVPIADRPARIIQLQSDIALYQASPGALVTALMVYSN